MNICTKCLAPYITAFPRERTLCPQCSRDEREFSRLKWFWLAAFGIVLASIVYRLCRL